MTTITKNQRKSIKARLSNSIELLQGVISEVQDATDTVSVAIEDLETAIAILNQDLQLLRRISERDANEH